MRRVIAGDERAWDEVVDRFAGLVWSVARSFRLSSAATDDVVQTVWLRLAEHCGRIREPDRLASWLATTTRNEALRVIRGNVRLTPQATMDDREPTTPSVEERVADDFTLRAVLWRSPSCRQEDQQLMRLLCAVPPLDYQTIAEMIGRPVGSIGPTRARCLERLKRLLPPGFDPKEASMTTSDDDLLAVMGRALRAAEPVPDHVVDRGPGGVDVAHHRRRARRAGLRLGAELTGVRSEDTARQLTFRAPGVEIEVMVVDDVVPPSRRPAGPAGRVHRAAGRAATR